MERLPSGIWQDWIGKDDRSYPHEDAQGRSALITLQYILAARPAKQAGVTGFVPDSAPWNCVYSGPDMGHSFLVGTRVSPFCFGWLKPGQRPMHELPLRLDRLAYKEFSRNPEKFFDIKASAQLLDDLFFVEESFTIDRTWDLAPVFSPAVVMGRIDLGESGPERLREYRDRLRKIGEPSTQELARMAAWIVVQWKHSPDGDILDKHLRLCTALNRCSCRECRESWKPSQLKENIREAYLLVDPCHIRSTTARRTDTGCRQSIIAERRKAAWRQAQALLLGRQLLEPALA